MEPEVLKVYTDQTIGEIADLFSNKEVNYSVIGEGRSGDLLLRLVLFKVLLVET